METNCMEKTMKLRKIQSILYELKHWLDLIPSSEDRPLTIGLKALGLGQILYEAWKGRPSRMEQQKAYAEEMGLEVGREPGFLNLVRTSLLPLFVRDSIVISYDEGGDIYTEIWKYSSDFGDLYTPGSLGTSGREDSILSEAPSSSSEDGLYWHTPNFDFNGLLSQLWNMYDNKINIEVGGQITYGKIVENDHPISPEGLQRVEDLSSKYLETIEDGISRTVLFWGSPGVGKTTLALQVAKKVGNRILRLEASSLRYLSPSSLRLLLNGLRPDNLIIDDIDRIRFDNLSDILTILDWIKVEHPGILILLTVNRVEVLDPAFIRPGRIDKVEKFSLPDLAERESLLHTYAGFFGSQLGAEELRQLAEASEGLGASWMREIVIQLRHSKLEHVLELIEDMKDIRDRVSYRD